MSVKGPANEDFLEHHVSPRPLCCAVVRLSGMKGPLSKITVKCLLGIRPKEKTQNCYSTKDMFVISPNVYLYSNYCENLQTSLNSRKSSRSYTVEKICR